MDNNQVSLTISKEIVNPIVETKVKEAILEALGGKESVVEAVVNSILRKKVDRDGRETSYGDVSYLDYVVTRQLKIAVEEEIKKQIGIATEPIKESLIKNLRSQKGSKMVASALMDGLMKTFEKKWTSDLKIEITPIVESID